MAPPRNDNFDNWSRRNPNGNPSGGPIGTTFAPSGTPAASSASASSSDPFSMFDDPSTNYLTQIIKNQIGSLQGAPATDPMTANLMAFLTKQLGSLSGAAPINFDVGNGYMNDFATEARQRIAELNQAPFTDAQEQALQTKTRNDVATQRDQAKQRLMEDASRRGIGASSGIVGQEVSNLEGQTTAQDAKNQNDMMLWIADQTQQRKNQAATIAQQLAAAGEQDAALRFQGQSASVNANMARQSQVMGIATTLANMAAQQRGEARARQGDILQMAGMLAELPVQRLQLASSILNGSGGNVGSLFGDVMGLNNAQTNATNTANGASSSWLAALAQLASYYANKK